MKVKHAGKTYELDLDPQTSMGIVLKEQLAALTGVAPSRQKILVKGKQVKDDSELSSLSITPKSILLMLGTPEEANASAKLGSQTVEEWQRQQVQTDAADAEAAAEAVEIPPAGLINLQNTCYANATVQALRRAPELVTAVESYQGNRALVTALGRLFRDFDKPLPEQSTTLGMFVATLRATFPQFGETNQYGLPKQQDAEEMWTRIMAELKLAEISEAGGLFDGALEVVTKPLDTPGESLLSLEEFTKLQCHITIHTNFLKDGLRAGLSEEIEKYSEAAGGTNARFQVTKRISRLPRYLTVQFVRFFWRRDTQRNSKILRKVAFPMQLDLADLCTDELQGKLAPARAALREWEVAEEEAKRAQRRARFSESRSDDSIEKSRDDAKRLHEKYLASVHSDVAADAGANPTGVYELQAVVTHQGMSADSGHYQCFARNASRPNAWWRFNDDKVSEVDDARIEQLAGGGEADSALILLYRTVQ